MTSRRIGRVASRIRFLISSIVQRELSDPRIGMVTILRVEPTVDLKEAKIFFSVFGDDAVKSRTLNAIEQARGFIQKEVGKNLQTRYTPRLRFFLDETQERMSRVENLIEQAVQEDQDNRHGQESDEEEQEEEEQEGGL